MECVNLKRALPIGKSQILLQCKSVEFLILLNLLRIFLFLFQVVYSVLYCSWWLRALAMTFSVLFPIVSFREKRINYKITLKKKNCKFYLRSQIWAIPRLFYVYKWSEIIFLYKLWTIIGQYPMHWRHPCIIINFCSIRTCLPYAQTNTNLWKHNISRGESYFSEIDSKNTNGHFHTFLFPNSISSFSNRIVAQLLLHQLQLIIS